MKRSRSLAGVVLLVAIGAIGTWLALRRPPEAPAPAAIDAGAPQPSASIVESAEPAVADAAPQLEQHEAPWVPSGSACRHAVAHGARFEQVSDSVITALIIDGYDPATRRAPSLKTVHVVPDGGYASSSWGTYFTRDCRGDRVEYDHPMTEAQRASPVTVLASPPSPDDDADASAGSTVRLDRYDVRDSRMAVYAAVAVQYGYYFQCLGFEAVVRLDEDEIVAEGVSPAQLYGCDEKGNELHLAPLDDRVALLLPISVGSGESGDYESAWSVSLPDHGALRHVGDVRRERGAGNGSIMSGRWFGGMKSVLLDGGAFQVEETWSFVRYETDGNETTGPKRKVVRTYELDGGKLARSPATDPTM